MKYRSYIMFFLLSLSWLLSSWEKHICIEDSSQHAVSVRTDVPTSSELASVLQGFDHEDTHDQEMCHFGHCSHGIGIVSSFVFASIEALPEILSSHYTPYPSLDIKKSALRPPALV
jgi:hypothetical protein